MSDTPEFVLRGGASKRARECMYGFLIGVWATQHPQDYFDVIIPNYGQTGGREFQDAYTICDFVCGWVNKAAQTGILGSAEYGNALVEWMQGRPVHVPQAFMGAMGQHFAHELQENSSILVSNSQRNNARLLDNSCMWLAVPLAIAGSEWDRTVLMEAARYICAHTHVHPVAVDAAVTTTVTLAVLIQTGCAKKACQAAKLVARTEDVQTSIRQSRECKFWYPSNDAQLGAPTYTHWRRCFTAFLYDIQNINSFASIVCANARLEKCPRSVAAMCGAFAGARGGAFAGHVGWRLGVTNNMLAAGWLSIGQLTTTLLLCRPPTIICPYLQEVALVALPSSNSDNSGTLETLQTDATTCPKPVHCPAANKER